MNTAPQGGRPTKKETPAGKAGATGKESQGPDYTLACEELARRLAALEVPVSKTGPPRLDHNALLAFQVARNVKAVTDRYKMPLSAAPFEAVIMDYGKKQKQARPDWFFTEVSFSIRNVIVSADESICGKLREIVHEAVVSGQYPRLPEGGDYPNAEFKTYCELALVVAQFLAKKEGGDGKFYLAVRTLADALDAPEYIAARVLQVLSAENFLKKSGKPTRHAAQRFFYNFKINE